MRERERERERLRELKSGGIVGGSVMRCLPLIIKASQGDSIHRLEVVVSRRIEPEYGSEVTAKKG